MADARHMAHFNYGTLIASADDPAVAEFIDAVPAVNALATRSPGYVWSMGGGEDAAARAIGRPLAEDGVPVIASFSVWASVEDFDHFVNNTLHGKFLRRRAEWFLPGTSGMVLWYVDAGHIPDVDEALDRLDQLRAEGPGPDVFTLKHWKAQNRAA